jgi:murein lipoprotein
MSRILFTLTSVALIGLAGCASQPAPTAAAKPAESKAVEAEKPALSAEAQAALAAAQADVKAARAKNALWTTAQDALNAAEAAAEKNDSATVLKQSKRASDQVRLGMEQLNYPMIKIGD